MSVHASRQRQFCDSVRATQAGEYCAATGVDIPGLRRFVDDSKAQIALLGIQFMWTADTQTALTQREK